MWIITIGLPILAFTVAFGLLRFLSLKQESLNEPRAATGSRHRRRPAPAPPGRCRTPSRSPCRRAAAARTGRP